MKSQNHRKEVITHPAVILRPFAFCHSERSEESDNAQGRLRRRICSCPINWATTQGDISPELDSGCVVTKRIDEVEYADKLVLNG